MADWVLNIISLKGMKVLLQLLVTFGNLIGKRFKHRPTVYMLVTMFLINFNLLARMMCQLTKLSFDDLLYYKQGRSIWSVILSLFAVCLTPTHIASPSLLATCRVLVTPRVFCASASLLSEDFLSWFHHHL